MSFSVGPGALAIFLESFFLLTSASRGFLSSATFRNAGCWAAGKHLQSPETHEVSPYTLSPYHT